MEGTADFLVLILSFITTIHRTQSQSNTHPQTLSNKTATFARNCVLYQNNLRVDCTYMHLEDVPEYLPENIQDFDLSHNEIKLIKNSSFCRYTKVIILDLSQNSIHQIEAAAFYPLTSLSELDLAYNRELTKISTDIFHQSQELKHLYMSGVGLQEFPPNTMTWLPKLTKLFLDDNDITMINISSCNERHHLEVLDISNNKIQNLTRETFVMNCKTDVLSLIQNDVREIQADVVASLDIRRLSINPSNAPFSVWSNLFTGIAESCVDDLIIRSVELSTIPTWFFKPLKGYPLSLLDLSANQMNNLYEKVFIGLSKLEKLSFQDQGVSEIKPEYFEGMEGLHILVLNDNDISCINPSNSTWNLGIRELHLSGNKMQVVSEYVFVGLDNLTVLNLANNPDLVYLDITSFSKLGQLRELDVSGSALQKLTLQTPLLQSISFQDSTLSASCLIPGDIFRYTKSLEIMNMRNSLIMNPNVWDSRTNVSLFRGLCKLKILSLGQNNLIRVAAGTFENLLLLSELDLSENKISHVDSESFRGLVALQTLNLCHNQIQVLPMGLLNGLSGLIHLHTDDNSLRYLDRNVFSDLRSLQNLTLANNKLSSFNRSVFEPFNSTLMSIDLSGNPLDCTCQTQWLADWLKEGYQVINENETLCSSSLSTISTFRNKPLLTFEASHFCRPNISLFYSIPLACFFFVLLVLIGYASYKNRWLIRYKIFTLRLTMGRYRMIMDSREQDDFEFDLNVMFMNDDDDWVNDHLRPVIEHRFVDRNRINFGDDNLPLGMHCIEAVHYVVQNSFKTVLVLSRAAVQDGWFIIQFRTAFDHVSDVQTENMVVVFLEDIPDNELPHVVRLYLKDHGTYLRWVEDEMGQECFWLELVTSLNVNLRSNYLIPVEV